MSSLSPQTRSDSPAASTSRHPISADGSFRRLAAVASTIAVAVVMLGAYVRLKNAGLGCPDWPGCYGKLTVADAIVTAAGGETAKAWIEMLHRYAAGGLGLLVAWIGWQGWRYRIAPAALPWLWGLLGLQVLLGMWTVTLRLHPYVVLLHLAGGMTLAASLFWLGLRPPRIRLYPPAIGFAAVLAIQILLGGWTSANYGGLACPDFPTCRGEWWPAMDPGAALLPSESETYEGGVLPLAALTAVHMGHRLWAVIVLITGLGLAWALRRTGRGVLGSVLIGLLLLQVGLGLGNVLLALPLPVAVAHTGGALLLLLAALAAAIRPMAPASGAAIRDSGQGYQALRAAPAAARAASAGSPESSHPPE